jgi:hypothetical protein
MSHLWDVLREALMPKTLAAATGPTREWRDLLMLVVAGGRERSEERWHALFASARREAARFPEHGPIEARAV